MQQDKNLKIGVCMHVFRSVDFACYYNHIYCLTDWAQRYDLVYCGKVGLDAAEARNQAADMVIAKGATHIFFMDADHLFPAETLPCLLELKDEAMVSGLVCKRGEGFPQVGFMKKDGKYLPVDLPLDGRVYEVGVCAFGCTLISVHHLQKLKRPWFRDDCREGVDGSMRNYRSDVNLCDALNDIGEKCFIHTGALIGHYGYDDVVYPQSAEMKKHCAELMKNALKLKKRMVHERPGQPPEYDEEGHYYVWG